MSSQTFRIIAGFILLFVLYHAAEYFVLFTYNPVGFFAFQLVFFGVAWLLAKWQGFSGLAAWGLDTHKGWFRNLLVGMCMGLVLYGGAFALSLWLKSEQIIEVPPFSSSWPQLVFFGVGVFFSSFSEDVLTRGYVYKHMASKASAVAVVFISSAIYLLNHIYRLGDGVETLLYIFLLGVLFIIPLVFTGRLWLTGGMHWMGNTTFFYTHNSIRVQEGPAALAPNTIFIIWIFIFIFLTVWVLRYYKTALSDKGRATTSSAASNAA